MESDLILVIVVGTALAFDFTNGFHDTANVVATSISTRAMPPRFAVLFAAIFNFVGAFLSLKVAATVGKDIVNSDSISMTIVFAGLIGAIAPIVAFLVAGVAIIAAYAIVARQRPGPVNRGYRLGQILSSGLLALSHGTNDAQKTMGIITLALVAHGNISADNFHVPD